MLIPREPPGTGENVDLLFLATSSLGFAILQGYAGNSLYVPLMGCEQGISDSEKFQANARVKAREYERMGMAGGLRGERCHYCIS